MQIIFLCGFSLIISAFGQNTTVKPHGVCPSLEISSYCECEDDIINCVGVKPYSLSSIFSSMSKSLTADQKHFRQFSLRNQGLTELEDNVFNGIRFDSITIGDTINLTKISPNAFNGTADDIIEISISGENQLGKGGQIQELFDVFSSLPNLRKLHFNTKTIDRIPENAFKSKQNNLTDIDFSYWFNETSRGSIKTIGNNAFYSLNNLNYLTIRHHSLDFISKNAFDFELASNKTLYIYLDQNNLNDTSFETGLFANTKRPLYIYLRDNKLTFLDEKIFGVFLRNDQKNLLNLDIKEFVCDCRMLWLMKDRTQFSKRVTNLGCKNYGIDFWGLTLKDFDNCSSI